MQIDIHSEMATQARYKIFQVRVQEMKIKNTAKHAAGRRQRPRGTSRRTGCRKAAKRKDCKKDLGNQLKQGGKHNANEWQSVEVALMNIIEMDKQRQGERSHVNLSLRLTTETGTR